MQALVHKPATPSAERGATAALVLGSLALGYAFLSAHYFYQDFFKFAIDSQVLVVGPSGVAVPVECGLWTVLSPWRLLFAFIAVLLLGASAVSLWRGSPRARVLSLFTLWGVLLPQLFWYTEFAFDWRAGQGVDTSVLAMLLAVGIPTALLYEGQATLAGWRLRGGHHRLLGAAVALAWIAFAATEIIDHSYVLSGSWAYVASFLAIPLAVAAVAGLFERQTWSLWLAVAAAALFGTALLAHEPAFRYGGYGYLDQMSSALGTCGVRRLFLAAVPVALVGWMVGPFLRVFIARAAGRSAEVTVRD